MASVFLDAARAVNAVLGSPMTYQPRSGGDDLTLQVTIDRSSPAFDELRGISSFALSASILKEELPTRPEEHSTLFDSAATYQVGRMYRETSAKWYVELDEIA